MAADKSRLKKELKNIRSDDFKKTLFMRKLEVSETNISEWNFEIIPSDEPYNNAAFAISMSFPRMSFLFSFKAKILLIKFCQFLYITSFFTLFSS